MSLLMDALRKAEADKKRAQPETEELALTDDARPVGAETVPHVPDDSDPSINVSFAETVDLGRTTGSRPVPSPGAELTLEPLEFLDLADDDETAGTPTDDREKPAASPDPKPAHTSTLPSMRGVRSGLDAVLGDSGGRLPPEPESPPAAADAGDVGITERVATAGTVFDAGSSGPSRLVIGWGIAVACFIGVLLLGAGFYYFQQAPTTQTLPSPSVAIDVEKSPPRELPVVPIEPAPDVDRGPTPRVAVAPEAPDAATAPPVEPLVPGMPVASPGEAPVMPAAAPVAAPATPVTPAALPVPVVAPLPPVDAPADAFTIARSGSAAVTEPLMSTAYGAWVAGDYAAAREAYGAVLERQPERRDALLGMAALELRDGNVAAAHALYRRVLARDPANPTAQAALASLEGGAGDLTESRLKMLLDAGVDGGYVFFTLGNLYARNARWADAQQAYFEALRHHPGNPDYNYNLAVALDRIGQRDTAVKYYAAAVDLTDAGRAGFDPAQALARINAISSVSTR